MRGAGAVAGGDGPLVVEHDVVLVAQRHHRLDADRRAVDHLGALAADPVVGHLRVHVHRRADAVPDVVLDDAVLPAASRARLGEAVLDGRAHGIQALAHPQRGDAGPQRGLGVVDELEVLGAGGLGAADDDG